MPFVLVLRDKNIIRDEILKQLRLELPKIVADRLSSDKDGDGPEAALVAADITVKFEDYGPFDVYEKPMEVIVFAGEYPVRVETKDERANRIAHDIYINAGSGALMPKDYFVWIFLGKSGFWTSSCGCQKAAL